MTQCSDEGMGEGERRGRIQLYYEYLLLIPLYPLSPLVQGSSSWSGSGWKKKNNYIADCEDNFLKVGGFFMAHVAQRMRLELSEV